MQIIREPTTSAFPMMWPKIRLSSATNFQAKLLK